MTSRTADLPSTARAATSRPGLAMAVVSAATFGGSGPFAKALLDSGWSPGAAVLLRVSAAALLLLPWTVAALRRHRPARREVRLVAIYGVVAVAGAQACYFSAVEHLSVGVALLLEYLAPVLLVALAWARTRQPPGVRTLAGTAVSMVGLVLVLDLGGAVDVDPVGVIWGLAAAVCLAVYFSLSARPMPGVPPVLLAGGGLAIGSVAIGLLGATGLLPLRATTQPVALLGTTTSWWIPAAVLVVVSTILAYLAGIFAAGRLGPRIASFVGLTEVLFAVAFAWLLLGELPVAVQLVGGLCILAGVALVEPEELIPDAAAHEGSAHGPARDGAAEEPLPGPSTALVR